MQNNCSIIKLYYRVLIIEITDSVKFVWNVFLDLEDRLSSLGSSSNSSGTPTLSAKVLLVFITVFSAWLDVSSTLVINKQQVSNICSIA